MAYTARTVCPSVFGHAVCLSTDDPCILACFQCYVCLSLSADAVVSLQRSSGSGVGLYDGLVQTETEQRSYVAAFRFSDGLWKKGQYDHCTVKHYCEFIGKIL